MSISAPDETSLKLLSGFARALVHQVRGPLSVVSNDLFYLQSVAKGEDFSRPLAQCQEINGILKQAASLGSEPLKFDSVSLLSLAREVFSNDQDQSWGTFECEPALLEEESLIYGDGARLKLALSWLKALLTSGQSGGASVLKIYLGREPRGLELGLLKNNSFFGSIVYDGDSLVDFFNLHLGLDSICPALAEAVFIAHGVEVKIQADDKLRVVLLFRTGDSRAVESLHVKGAA